MEAALFFFDCLVLLWLCVCASRADTSGNPDLLGLFQYEHAPKSSSPSVKKKSR